MSDPDHTMTGIRPPRGRRSRRTDGPDSAALAARTRQLARASAAVRRPALATVSALARGGPPLLAQAAGEEGRRARGRRTWDAGRWAVQGVDRRPSIRMLSKRL